MTDPHVIGGHAAIVAALHDPRLVPHGSDDPSTGSTQALRGAMARFSTPVAHAPRRERVVAAIDAIDLDEAERTAGAITRARLEHGVSAVDEIAGTVPTATLASLLGLVDQVVGGNTDEVVDAVVDAIIDDVEAIVRVIGRGEPATPASDAAADRLVALGGFRPAGPTAVVSMLYQNFDATTALVRTMVEAHRTGRPARPAVAATRRVAVDATVVDGHPIRVGDEVVLQIGSAGLPYGVGPHECPGRMLAERIAAGIVRELVGEGPDPAT